MALSELKTAIWGAPSVERSLLIKLDSTILIYFSLIWFLFGINRASYSTAYISGMKEDVGFKGKDYNYMSTVYLVCYAVFQMPSTSALTIIRPKYVFVVANVVWSVLTLVTFRVEHVWQVLVLNGFEGAFSAIAYVGAHFIYGSWYKQSELGTRAAVFCGFGNLGNMAGGWIQAALLKSVTGKGSLPPWRWMFIVVSLMTIPFAIFVYSLCVQSLGNNVMALWMASRGYSVIDQNNYPTGVYAVAIVATLMYTIISDRIQSRWECSLVIGVTFVVGSAILVAHPAGVAGYFFAFYLLGSTYAPQALWYTWMADLTAQDVQLRAITTGFMNSFDFAFVSWWPIIFYPVTDAPSYEKGYIASLVTGALTIPVILLITLLEKRGRARGEIGRVAAEEEEVEPQSGNDAIVPQI
ncbi:hypothetical protein VSDG_02956 [Cytospora chrysosperma]|uniref:Major facilitator superfamily (MFS) profile domain-containing protein n=1 Tax=Cytospora chrysosperma TaxID=252740 RepID=A0A423W8X7_CYTCH|nr:hypothetical protein VSDG_02956 [Valsa sordida]